MKDKEKIKEEIESYKESMKSLWPHSDFRKGQLTAYNQILQRIDSFSEESVSEDLEEAAELYYEEDCPYEGDARVVNNEHDVWFPSQAIEDAFIAGAEWQKQQMMKDAVETNLYLDGKFLTVDYDFSEQGYQEGDRIKFVIIKEE